MCQGSPESSSLTAGLGRVTLCSFIVEDTALDHLPAIRELLYGSAEFTVATRM